MQSTRNHPRGSGEAVGTSTRYGFPTPKPGEEPGQCHVTRLWALPLPFLRPSCSDYGLGSKVIANTETNEVTVTFQLRIVFYRNFNVIVIVSVIVTFHSVR